MKYEHITSLDKLYEAYDNGAQFEDRHGVAIIIDKNSPFCYLTAMIRSGLYARWLSKEPRSYIYRELLWSNNRYPMVKVRKDRVECQVPVVIGLVHFQKNNEYRLKRYKYDKIPTGDYSLLPFDYQKGKLNYAEFELQGDEK